MNGESEMEMVSNMANCLILLSKADQTDTRKRVFTCKTCKKEFPSFQALGGHRASHRKNAALQVKDHAQVSPKKAKTAAHECSICGIEFATGQALGGHMRRHTSGMNGSGGGRSKKVLCLDLNWTPLENLRVEIGRMIS